MDPVRRLPGPGRRPAGGGYLLVIGAAALRLAALWPGPHTLAALHGATAAWVLAFVLYLWRFAPLLVRPRLRAPTAAATPVRSRP
ncbi:NnrS family protein [Bordetella pertussis]|uniref:NnrS family protein n=1 Tax=Bordetella pertussis TaxID=520 RepID=UPI0006DBDA7A|nr:NnrS family protein [Bordetella pertussis]